MSKISESQSLDPQSQLPNFTAVVLTNQENLGSQSSIASSSANSSILYENDFDLYLLLKEMALNKSKSKKQVQFDKTPRAVFKTYTKALTACLLDSHFTNGKNSWYLIESGIDLYRSKVKCIGTNINDFDYGDPVFLDLQPLSTRVKLMCKLIIIIQGACLERSGPPKLVQDRCIQFDGMDNREDTLAFIKPKIKSNSCENLLEELCLPFLKEEPIQSYQSNLTRPGQISDRLSRKKSIRSNVAVSDDESSLSSYYNMSSNNKSNESLNTLISNSCDLEHYFKYRVSKNFNKDYASAPYYQYSSVKKMLFADKSTNTVNSYLSEMYKAGRVLRNGTSSSKMNNQSTSTDDLLSNSQIGYFSKYQLLSSQTLFEKKSSLINSYASIRKTHPMIDDSSEVYTSTYSNVPINIRVRTSRAPMRVKLPIRVDDTGTESGRKPCLAVNDIFEDIEVDDGVSSRERDLYSSYKKVYEILKLDENENEKGINLLSSVSNFELSSTDENKNIKFKSRPQKSSEWSIFKNKLNRALEKTDGEVFSTLTTITTTKTTKITETSVQSSDLTEYSKLM